MRMSKKARNYRGSFACVGSDDQIHSVEAKYASNGEVELLLDDGRPLSRIAQGLYVTNKADGDRLVLTSDHPDAP